MEGEVASEVSPGDREGIQERDENEEEGGQVENRCQEAEANAGDLRPPVAVQDGRASTGSSCVKAAAPSDVENSQSSHLSSEEDLLCSPGASSVSSLSFLAFAHAASSVSSLGRQSTSSDASSPLPSSSSTNPSASSESSASSSSASSSFSHSSSLPASSCSGSSSASSSSSPSSSPSTSSSSCAASSAASSSLRSSVPGGVGSESDTGRQAGRLHAMSLHVAEAVCSEQVVLGLKSICKELVENAVDAGATTVEVRFVDGGMASVEVRDNGSGIAPQDFPMLGRRHATSKINKFADLYSALDTLGFRGEALASLCALSDVEILTRTASEPFATRLRFDHHGKIIHQEPAAREVGTSVTVSNLFASLPLRRRALQQQRQKHLQESLAFLQKFALLHADDCRVLVTDFTPANTSRSAEASGSQRRNGGNCVTLLNTRGTATRLMDAAVTVYGERQMQQCSQVSLAGSEEGREWSVEVLLSRPPLGVRTSALQLFFVNKRVVEFPPLLQKLINKKYREVSSRHCFPIVIAFATVAPHLLEVNLRKDKQEVLLAVEKEITEALLKTITDFVAPTVASFQTARGFSQVPRGVSLSPSTEASSRGSCSSSTPSQRSAPSHFCSPSQPRLPPESCSPSLPSESCTASSHSSFRSPAAEAKRETGHEEEDGTSRDARTSRRAGVGEERLRVAHPGEPSGETRDLNNSGDLKEGERSTREATSFPEKENVADETCVSCFSSLSSPPFLSASTFPALESTSSGPPSAVASNRSAVEGETRHVGPDHEEEGGGARRRCASSPQTPCSSDEENLPLSVRLERKRRDQRCSSYHPSSSTSCSSSSSSSLVSLESSSVFARTKGRRLPPSKPEDAEGSEASSRSSSPCSPLRAARSGSPDVVASSSWEASRRRALERERQRRRTEAPNPTDGGAEREREEGEKGDEAEGKRREEADDFGSFEKRRIERKGVPSRTQLKRREDEFVSENKLLKETIASAVAECHCTDEDLAALYGASDAENDKETQHEPVASSSASPAVASFCISECPAAFSFASSSDTRVIGAFDPGTSSFFLDKRAFSEMKVVGQFNQGFIIGCLVSQVPSGDPPVESGDSHEFRQAPQTPQLVSPSSLSASPSSSSSSSSSASSSSSVPSASPASKREVRSVFIVDQHASDEKKRFEDLNAAFKPATQPLLLPLRLHLPVDMARAVSDFDREIRANGFRVKVARERSRVHAREERDAACAAEASEDAADAPLEEETVISLLGLPVIEGRQLKEEDFIEFVASLLHDEEGHATAARWRRRRRKKRRKRTPELAQKKGESPGTPEKPSEETVARGGDNTRGPQAGDDEVDVKHGSGSEGGADEDESDEGEDESEAEEAHAFHHRVLLCRPKKVWEILASRACRSAIMIGDSLTVNQMQTVLKNLATLHLPFNCPHGRPTVRHLFDLHLPAVYPPEREVRRVPWERQRGAEEAAADDGEAEDAARGDAGKGAEELGNVEERAGSERTKEEMEATGNWRGRRAERQRLKGVDASSPDKQKGRGEERREEKHETEGREEEGDVVGGRFKVRRKRCREEKKRGEKRRKKKKVEQATGLEEDLSAEQHRELTKAQAHRREEKEHHEIFAEEKGLFDEDDPDVVADGEETNEQKCLSLRDWKADDRCLDAASSRPPQMKLYELSFEAHK